ncbi:MAG: cytochrome c biogenesis CcdA family protein [Candidatus Rokuibacteriota bacterium]
MNGVLLAWYGWLSSLTQGLVVSLQALADSMAVPAAAAVIFGLIGATSPCQLSTNLGALAYVAARPSGGSAVGLALAYVAGKVTVYSVVGTAVVLAGLQLQAVSIPVVVAARKALGPLMIVVGLALIGLWSPRVTLGRRLAERLRSRVNADGPGGAYLLGLAFSLAFCPTLFWLFFGLTVPLALRSAGGWSFPGLFAIGSSLPLLVVATLVTVGAGAMGRMLGSMRRLERPLRLAAAFILLVVGLHDTLLYWAL